jgi:hypothetical protein
MYLVELLLPLYDNKGHKVSERAFADVRDELTERYGGVTAFTRSPAQGTWVDRSGEVARDDVIVCEVMVENLDTGWWADYRRRLEKLFGQEELVIRATETRRL